jgi:hypothetical protein
VDIPKVGQRFLLLVTTEQSGQAIRRGGQQRGINFEGIVIFFYPNSSISIALGIASSGAVLKTAFSNFLSVSVRDSTGELSLYNVTNPLNEAHLVFVFEERKQPLYPKMFGNEKCIEVLGNEFQMLNIFWASSSFNSHAGSWRPEKIKAPQIQYGSLFDFNVTMHNCLKIVQLFFTGSLQSADLVSAPVNYVIRR